MDEAKIAELLRSKITELEATSKDGKKKKKNQSKSASKTKVKNATELLENATLDLDAKVKGFVEEAQHELEECRKIATKADEAVGRAEDAEKEKDASWGELNKALKTKQKLESLCAELQKQQRDLLDENKKITDQERSRRQELADKFQWTIKDVREKMDQQAQERLEQVRENDELRAKFKKFLEQYEEREKELIEQQKRRELETQMVGLRLSEQEQLYKQEATRLSAQTAEYETLSNSETILQQQLKTYGDKFSQFQDTLSKSNKVFEKYKRERNRLQRKVETLEKENVTLKEKNEKKNATAVRDGDRLLKEKDELEKQSKVLLAEKKELQAKLDQLRGT